MQFDLENHSEDAKKFRGYAAECRRLASTASERDRPVLLEIAEAWITCAQEAERAAKRGRKS
jgi:hypothetical protein